MTTLATTLELRGTTCTSTSARARGCVNDKPLRSSATPRARCVLPSGPARKDTGRTLTASADAGPHHAAASRDVRGGARRAPSPLPPATALERRGRQLQHPRSTRAERTPGWRDFAQSLALDAAELPLLPRLLAGQVLLALGYTNLRAALALSDRLRDVDARATHPQVRVSLAHALRRHPLLAAVAAAAGITFVWGSLAYVSRTRAAPVVTAIFAYGNELRNYVPPLRSLAPAA